MGVDLGQAFQAMGAIGSAIENSGRVVSRLEVRL
jgi:hypothetical protein